MSVNKRTMPRIMRLAAMRLPPAFSVDRNPAKEVNAGKLFAPESPRREVRDGAAELPRISFGAKIETVKTPGLRMDIAKDKFLTIRVLSRFWLLQEPPEDQVFNVKYFCDNAYIKNRK